MPADPLPSPGRPRPDSTRSPLLARSLVPSGRPPSLHHAHWGRPVRRGPVAELAGAVLAPAIGGARGRDPASVVLIGAHRGEGHAARHENRGRPPSRGP